jgi:hypothetical protein
MENAPNWAQILTAFSTLGLGSLAAVIAYMQWRTNHQKVVLDLFDRRYKIYEKIVAIVYNHLKKRMDDEGHALEALTQLGDVKAEATLLFGNNIILKIINIQNKIREIYLCNLKISSEKDESKRADLTCGRIIIIEDLIATRGELIELLAPYMRMNQKPVQTPSQSWKDLMKWLKERSQRNAA